MDKFGKVDILINNAGVIRKNSLKIEENWKAVMDSHYHGPFKCTKAAWNSMREKGYGRIINISSPAGLYGENKMSDYSTVKLGIHGFTQSLAIEGAKRNIRTNTIAPLGDTRMLR